MGQLFTLWRALPKFILCKILLERNNRIFRETTSNLAQVETEVKTYFGESAPYFYEANKSGPIELEEEQWIKSFKIRDHSQQTGSKIKQETWEICKEEEDFEEWKLNINMHILFFDGASKGNPGVAGADAKENKGVLSSTGTLQVNGTMISMEIL
jgi:hypothetical protein